MKKRSLIITVLVFVLSFTLMVNSAMAGSSHHERWEGVAIGLGAAILGSALIHHSAGHPCQRSEDCRVTVITHRDYRHETRGGYWEIRKEWIPPTYKEVWNPGHYSRDGEWIEGHWMKIVDRPGYWAEERIWVASKSTKRHSGRSHY